MENLLVDKKLKTFATDVGTKTVQKQLGSEKRNLSVELVECFLKEVDEKLVALAETFLIK